MLTRPSLLYIYIYYIIYTCVEYIFINIWVVVECSQCIMYNDRNIYIKLGKGLENYFSKDINIYRKKNHFIIPVLFINIY